MSTGSIKTSLYAFPNKRPFKICKRCKYMKYQLAAGSYNIYAGRPITWQAVRSFYCYKKICSYFKCASQISLTLFCKSLIRSKSHSSSSFEIL